jgi:RNA polymerase sigma factor (sigma-70 family)
LPSDSRPVEEFTKKNIAEHIRSIVELLPPVYKTLVTLYHLHEFSYKEIQEITGMREGTIKSYLFRARIMMKEHISNHLKNEI